MSDDHYRAVKTEIVEATGKEIIANFLEIADSIKSSGPSTGSWKFLMSLQDIYTNPNRENLKVAGGTI